MLGQTLGNYRIARKLGQGGMGTVYLAEHTLLGSNAAIKVLLPELSSKQEIVNRFFNEAKASTTINHPGIVSVHDFGYATDGSAYLVMEYLAGESLDARLNRLGRLSVSEALRVGAHCASALAAAHGRGIVHRDLKPDNIFLVPDPQVAGGERAKILDFGIAKLTDDQAINAMVKTQTGSVMGTPIYMSPEQCRGAGEVDYRSDIYSLGCVIYHMLCGQPPFMRPGVGAIMGAHMYEPPPPARTHSPHVPAEIEAWVNQTLAKDPAHRPATMTEVAHAAEALIAIAPTDTPSAPAIDAHGRPMPAVSTNAQAPGGSSPGAYVTPAPGQSSPGGYPTPPPSSPEMGSYPPHSMTPPTTLGGAAVESTASGQPTRRWGAIIAVAVTLLVGGGVAAVVLSGSSDGAEQAQAGPATPDKPDVEDRPVAKDPPTPAVTATVDAAIPNIAVQVSSEPIGASVYGDDDKPLGVTPYEYTAPPRSDEVTLRLRKPGYLDETISFKGDEDGEVQIALREQPKRKNKRKKKRKDDDDDDLGYR